MRQCLTYKFLFVYLSSDYFVIIADIRATCMSMHVYSPPNGPSSFPSCRYLVHLSYCFTFKYTNLAMTKYTPSCFCLIHPFIPCFQSHSFTARTKKERTKSSIESFNNNLLRTVGGSPTTKHAIYYYLSQVY